ncbi:hypothetical protein ACHAP5_004909 [Fusarium lateritium]
MAASINVLRSDIQDLAKEFPELAEQFKCLREQLDSTFAHSSQLLIGEDKWADQTSLRYNAGKGLSAVLTEIRSKPGFKWFLRPEDEKLMKSAAALGPVIVVNDQTGVVLLPSLSKCDIDLKHRSLGRGSLRVLEWLWDTVAEPILDALGFTKPPLEGNLKRVWWVLTDSLSTFPIHAAGRHNKRNGETVMDRVMSSYATSVAAIVQSCRTRETDHVSATNEALLVSASQTPGYSELMFANKEVRMLRDVCQNMSLQPVEPVPQRDVVLSHLRKCKVFHFAGHGHTDTTDPAKSQLFLEDWQTHPLTIRSLLELNLQKEGPFLAYLSACGTGQIKSQKLFDEGIHLISACQLAGFRHVIGTLWEVNDESCVDMAAIIYDEIYKGGMSDDSVCRGVYVATKAKRDQWLQNIASSEKPAGVIATKATEVTEDGGEFPRTIIACDDSDEEEFLVGGRNRPLHWVPYVHFGA